MKRLLRFFDTGVAGEKPFNGNNNMVNLGVIFTGATGILVGYILGVKSLTGGLSRMFSMMSFENWLFVGFWTAVMLLALGLLMAQTRRWRNRPQHYAVKVKPGQDTAA